MAYELPGTLARDIRLALPGHDDLPPKSITARGVVSTGPDSAPARVYGRPVPFPHRRFAAFEPVPPASQLRGRSKRVVIV